MVFSSPTFLFAFLPVVLVATWLAPTALRRFVILGASWAFYAWGVQEFVVVIAASTLIDWALARGIAARRARDDARAARLLLLLGVGQNLALLAWFKYADFASRELARLADAVGLDGPQPLGILLPIGISFFTFEKISYLVDVWRGDVAARRDPLDVLLFVALFPRAIAGPIVRLREVAADLRRPQPRADAVADGAVRFSYGLAKKVLIADQIAPIADAAFAAAEAGTLTTSAAWLGAVAYTLQLYFDFSAYTDMAIGIGLMLGFQFPENFRRPYSAVSMTDFWRRWHMSLTRWFRDYVYIPLGGSRGSSAQTTRNVLIVFGLVGIWHGAGWTFVLWGLYHGAWLVLERRMGWRATDGVVHRPWARRTAVLLIVLVGWVLFRAEDLSVALRYYEAMVVPTGTLADARWIASDLGLFVTAVGALIFFAPGARSAGVALTTRPDSSHPTPQDRPTVAVARGVVVAVVLPVALVAAFASTFSPFLYFRF